MLTLNAKVESGDSVFAKLVLPYELRENSRLRTALASGEEVAIFTARGTALRNNDLLKAEDGRIVQIIAAQEPTYRVTCATPYDLLRCAFHLGNRHTQTQVGEGFLRILQDSVLKEMLEGLGATVTAEDAPDVLAAIGGRPLVVVVHDSVDADVEAGSVDRSAAGATPSGAALPTAPAAGPTG